VAKSKLTAKPTPGAAPASKRGLFSGKAAIKGKK
jgi:hypothetical protein